MKYLILSLLFSFSAHASWFVANGSITQAKLAARSTGSTVPAGGYAISPLVATFTSGSTSPVQVTNASVVITTTGRPVRIAVTSSSVGGSVSCVYQGSGADSGCAVEIWNGSTVISRQQFISFIGEVNSLLLPPTTFSAMDTPIAGTYTYTLRVRAGLSSDTVSVNNIYLTAYEL